MPRSLKLILAGCCLAAIGVLIASGVWRLGGIVVLMLAMVPLLVGRFMRINQRSQR